MRKLILAAALIGAAAVVSPALAQDTGAASPGRFHAEVIAGYDRTEAGLKLEGAVYGVGAGYDFHLGRTLTLGPDAEATTSSADKCGMQGNFTLCGEARRDLYAGARLGLRFGPAGRHLVYVGGGYTNLHYNGSIVLNNGPFTISEDYGGYRIKAGVELGIGRRLFARAEYRFSRYDEAVFDRHQVVGALGLRF